jgi:hypothetical protein
MLIGRCAWHLQYYGHPHWYGVASWRGFKVRFTDGICRRCLERFRVEHRAKLLPRPPVVATALATEKVAS